MLPNLGESIVFPFHWATVLKHAANGKEKEKYKKIFNTERVHIADSYHALFVCVWMYSCVFKYSFSAATADCGKGRHSCAAAGAMTVITTTTE
jgi:hypothetical protein